MSTLRTNKIENTAGVEQFLAKAWVNFNGTGTVAIRAAGNVSSITDNAVGDYTVNLTNPMADANYAFEVSSGSVVGHPTLGIQSIVLNSSSARTVLTGISGSTQANVDSAQVSATFYR